MDILEKILKFLTARELVMLSLTSKALNLVVRTYIDHQVERMALRSQFEEFCERNRDCLLPKEVVLKDRLNQNTRPNLLLFSTGNHFIGEKSFFIRKQGLTTVDVLCIMKQLELLKKFKTLFLKGLKLEYHFFFILFCYPYLGTWGSVEGIEILGGQIYTNFNRLVLIIQGAHLLDELGHYGYI